MIQPYLQLPDRKIISYFMVCGFLLLCFVKTGTAQTDYAKLTVVVQHKSTDLAVPNVAVTLSEGKSVRTRQTNAEGRCVFEGLAPATYELQVLSSVVSIELMPGQNAVRSFKVVAPTAPGAAATAATVQAATPGEPQLKEGIVFGRQGERVTSKQLEDLPNPDQSEVPLIQRQTGVFNSGATSLGGFIFNGQPGGQNTILEAGVNSTVIVRSSTSFQDTAALFFDVKDRQSIKKYSSFGVDTNNTPAKFGTGTGGQLIEEISKGDKDFNGEVYEYLANDAFSARNFFDFARKPSLRFNLFGVSLGGPLIKDRLTAFFNYEGIRASSGNTIFAAAPKLSLESTADAAVAPLLSSFRADGASIIPGASEDPNFDIIQLESKNRAKRNGVTIRLDYTLKDADTLGFIYVGSRSTENTPDGASGRRTLKSDKSHMVVFNYQQTLTANDYGDLTNQVIFGFIDEPTRLFARRDDNNGPALFASSLSIGDEVAQSSILGQPTKLGIATAGGLLGGDFNGRHFSLVPRQFSFIDQMVWTKGDHTLTFGGEVRLLRNRIDQLFGTTYKFETLNDFLANHAGVEHDGDLGSLTGNAGERKTAQEYYIAFLQHKWQATTNLLLTYGLRYEYYTPLREEQQSVVNIDPLTGLPLPAGADLYKSRKNNFLPRVSIAWAPKWGGKRETLESAPLVFSGSFGVHVGPDVFDNILRPVTNNQLHLSGSNLAFPVDLSAMLATSNPQDAQLKPVVLSRDYSSPSRVYKWDFTAKHELVRRDPLDSTKDALEEAFFTLSYVGNRSRNLLLRNFANRIISVETNPNPELPAKIRREFDIDNGGELLHPYGEFEYLTTGGRASYDSFQASVQGRLRKYLKMFQFDYTLARNRGNSDGDDAIPTGNPLDYGYDFGYSALDIRHKLSYTALLAVPCPSCVNHPDNHLLNLLLGDWTIASTGFYQTGVPIDIRLARPDIVYVDQAGNVFSKPAADRQALLNVPGGGSSVVAYRPNLIPGVNPYLKNDRNFLNPAAFSIPAPGELGNLSRGALRGPRVRIIDFSLQKKFDLDGEGEKGKKLVFNMDLTNLFNFTNFKLASAKLDNKLGTDTNELQPGQPYTAVAVPDFGVMTTTFKRKSDLGSSRQIQFGVSLKF